MCQTAIDLCPIPACLQANRSPALAALLGDMRVATLYLRLLCLYEPRSGVWLWQLAGAIGSGHLLFCHVPCRRVDQCPHFADPVSSSVLACLHRVLRLAVLSIISPLPCCSAALPAGPRCLQCGRVPGPVPATRCAGETPWCWDQLRVEVGQQCSLLCKAAWCVHNRK